MRLDHLLSKEHWHLGSWSFVAGGWFEGVQVACRDRWCRGGCSRVEHRLVGIAWPVAVAGTGSSPFGVGLWKVARGVGGVWHVVGA